MRLSQATSASLKAPTNSLLSPLVPMVIGMIRHGSSQVASSGSACGTGTRSLVNARGLVCFELHEVSNRARQIHGRPLARGLIILIRIH